MKKCCRWKLSSKIFERNVGLDVRYDIDKYVKIVHALVSNYARNKELCNKYRLFNIIYYQCMLYHCEMNGNLFVFNCISFEASFEYHILYCCSRWTMFLVFIICSYLLYSRKRWYAGAFKEFRFVLVCFFCSRKRLELMFFSKCV